MLRCESRYIFLFFMDDVYNTNIYFKQKETESANNEPETESANNEPGSVEGDEKEFGLQLGKGENDSPLLYIPPRPGLFGFFNVGVKVIECLKLNAHVSNDCVIWNRKTKYVTVEGVKIQVRNLVYQISIGDLDSGSSLSTSCNCEKYCIKPTHLVRVTKGLKRKRVPSNDIFIQYKPNVKKCHRTTLEIKKS